MDSALVVAFFALVVVVAATLGAMAWLLMREMDDLKAKIDVLIERSGGN